MDNRAHKNIHVIYIKDSWGTPANSASGIVVSTDSKKEIIDSVASNIILQSSGKRAKKEHTGRDTTDFLGQQCKGSLEHKGTAWAKHGDKPLNEEHFSQSKADPGPGLGSSREEGEISWEVSLEH